MHVFTFIYDMYLLYERIILLVNYYPRCIEIINHLMKFKIAWITPSTVRCLDFITKAQIKCIQ